MTNLGVQLKRLPAFSLVRDLEQYRFPFLSVVKGAGGAPHIQKWCCRAFDAGHRVLIVNTTYTNISHYLARKTTMWDLLVEQSSNTGLLCDYEGQELKRAWLVEVDGLPPDYLPDREVKHDPELRPHSSHVEQDFLFDDGWTPDDFVDARRNYVHVASFAYVAEHAPGAIAETLEHHNLRGFSYHHAFSGLHRVVPRELRAITSGMSGHSPGVLTLRVPRETAVHVAEAISKWKEPGAQKAYWQLHKWSTLERREAHRLPASAESDLRRLCVALGLDPELFVRLGFETAPDHRNHHEGLDRALGLLHVGKLVAGYFRVIERVVSPGRRIEFVEDSSLLRRRPQAEDGEGDEDDEDDEEPDRPT